MQLPPASQLLDLTCTFQPPTLENALIYMSERHYLPVFLSHFSLTAALPVFKCCVGQKLTFTFFRAPQDTALVPVPGCMTRQCWLIFPGRTPLCPALPHEHPMLAVCS